MALFNKKYAEDQHDAEMLSECLCKFRGVPSDYPDGKMPVDKVHGEESTGCGGDCTCGTKKSLADDMTFGQLIGLVNRLLKEVNALKERLDGGQEL